MRRIKQLSVISNLQIVFWVSFAFLSTYSFSQTAPFGSSVIRAAILVLLNAILFYSCYLYLVPQLFEKKRYVQFYLLLFLLITVITALRVYLKNNVFDFMQVSKINISANLQVAIIVLSELTIALISSLMKVAKDKYEYERKYQATQNQFLKSELNYLKSQISPHFLLNALNNIYSFAVTNSPQTPGAVLKLSEILKYFLYESNGAKIPVKREMEIIQSYIGLFALKFQDAPDISFDECIKNSDKEIEPLLLMSLVENAFKHSGVGVQENSFIHITIKENDEQLIFSCVNSNMQVNEKIGQYGGIGLQNISKRLLLNYPGKHSLDVVKDDNTFSVKLTIPFL
ncbi:MAG: sensor histidine kinase [Rhizobacter sp.]|nr:sensor histidine kinase [Ferruginibacter sp.]